MSERDGNGPSWDSYECIICGKAYGKEILLYAHITSHSEEIMEVEDDADNPKMHACKLCDFTTGNPKAFNVHRREHVSSMNPNKENRSPTESAKKPRTRTTKLFCLNEDDGGRGFECGECGETSDTKQGFEGHAKDEETKPYRCEICCRRYKGKKGLKWHMKAKHGTTEGTEYRCDVCEKVHSTLSELQKHVSESHPESFKLECEFCGKSLGEFQMSEHKKVCGKDLKSEVSEDTNEENYECDTCKKSFRTKKRILLHLVRTHLSESDNKTKSSGEVENCIKTENLEKDFVQKRGKKKKRVKLEKPFKCDEENCSYSTAQYSLLNAHKFKHNPFYKCVTCREEFKSRPELKAHMFTHGERPYKCDQCNKCYKDQHGLGWHKKVQHDPSRLKFTCELCGKTYPFDSLLTQHINLTHAVEKQSVCDICGKNVSKTYLPMHRRTHGEKQYSCDVCQKTFIEKAYLKRHRMIHTGEKPYVCSVCGNLFRQHGTLKIHMRTHTGDRPYKCVLCENAYKTHHSLKKHYRKSGHKLV